ncbi:MAG: glycosyltransferase family 9 protein [Candidatus Hydrogenedentes bacterium]|nr:glycosyltransferase family 9 protein [Candidatus Hydrogenedentota bacterium]
MARAESYEAAWGPVSRRVQRVLRGLHWSMKTFRGKQRMILVEIDWRLGDEIMAIEAVHALRMRYPRDAIFVLSNYPELYAFVDFPVIVNTRPPRVDRYYLLRGEDRLLPRPESNARRIGQAQPLPNPHLLLNGPPHPKVQALRNDCPVIVIAHETTWINKHWAPENWIELTERLLACHMAVIELGVRNALGLGQDLVGKTAVRDAAHILRDVDLLVSVDCGLMHLALAVGTPVVALFGPTDPGFLVPDHPLLHAILNPKPCQGFWNHDPIVPPAGECTCGEIACLDAITVDVVFEAIQQALKEGR